MRWLSPNHLLAQMARATLGVPPVHGPQRVNLMEAQLERYAGTYALVLPGGARDFNFFVRCGTLYSQLAGQKSISVIHYGNDPFGLEFAPALRLVFTIVVSRATRVTLHREGGV